MRTITTLLMLLILVYPLQARADDRLEIINPPHYIWPEIESNLPNNVDEVIGLFHTGTDGKEYVLIYYTFTVEGLSSNSPDEWESHGLLIGEVGGDYIKAVIYGYDGSILEENNEILSSYYQKCQYASFSENGISSDFLFIKGTQIAVGGSGRWPFFIAYQLNNNPLDTIEEAYWYPPGIEDRCKCDIILEPELNRVIIWTQVIVGNNWTEPFKIKQYMYEYVGSGFDLVRMDTTSELYTSLPNYPPFAW